MSWKNEQILPDVASVLAVTHDAIMPTIAIPREEVPGLSYRLSIETWRYEEKVNDFDINIPESETGIGVSGKVRLRFRKTFRNDRILFFAQLRLDHPLRMTGYTGFLLRGSIRLVGDKTELNHGPPMWQYNASHWYNP